MINNTDKHNCCGCSACASVCPKACITMQADEEGFLYPKVDVSNCIDCGLCEKTCPFLASLETKQPLHTYAAVNPNEEDRYNSSSGGIFTMLVRETIDNGGVVYGAVFDWDWSVHHIAIEREEDIPLLQGSKYIQSVIGGSFKSAKEQLQSGRNVLFSGTACQIAGLKNYLRKDYDNLLTVDVVCHGVPSPMIWQDYITTLQNKSLIEHISFRDKQPGWRNYNFSIVYKDGRKFSESHNENLYIQGFLRDLYIRPSCHNCKVKAGRCASDITLGDFWGIDKVYPDLNDNQGVSVVLANTQKGNDIIKAVAPNVMVATYEQAIICTPCIVQATPENKWKSHFWEAYNIGVDLPKCVNIIIKKQKPSLLLRILRKIKACLRQRLVQKPQ